MINLTVFCSSKNNLDKIYYESAEKLINLVNINKYNIVYGGGKHGIMGLVRKTFMKNGGNVISSNVSRFIEMDNNNNIIDLNNKINYKDDYIYDNIDDRQKKLMELGQAYLILPGGYGTHFEMLEVMTKNDIGEESKPIFIFNCNNIFDNLIKLVENLIAEKFITRDFAKIKVFISANIDELATLINNYNFN